MSTWKNADATTIRSFSEEWSRFDQASLGEQELQALFDQYFHVFPWDRLPPSPRGADVGCGSGRWARGVVGRVAELHCIDASERALEVARRNLAPFANVVFHHASVDALPFEDNSLDFVYSLGVLHHVPDTAAAIRSCTRILKPGAPLLLYLYYAFDNRPGWYRAVWRLSDKMRGFVARLPPALRDNLCDVIAATVYWPLARTASIAHAAGLDVSALPLSVYRDRSFYTMRTDARDRFGTPLERRFTAEEIREMMTAAGLRDIRFSDRPPYWCAVGFKADDPLRAL